MSRPTPRNRNRPQKASKPHQPTDDTDETAEAEYNDDPGPLRRYEVGARTMRLNDLHAERLGLRPPDPRRRPPPPPPARRLVRLVPTRRDVHGRPSKFVEVTDLAAAQHWDGRLWRPERPPV